MSERLRPDDMAFLVTESASTPMHNATLEIFEPPASGFDYDRLLALIADRIAFVPRYRQRLRIVPGRLANPVWVDDEDFDLTFHVRRSALPRPGSMDQLRDLTARIMSRQLDRHRPLWEMYLIEGARGRPVRDPVQVPPDPRRRRRHHRPRPGDPRRRPDAARDGPRRLAPAARAEPAGAGRRRRARLRARPAAGPGDRRAATPARVFACGERGRRPGRRRSPAPCPTAARRPSRRSTRTLSEQRRFVDGEDLAAGLPPGAALPRRHRQRRHPRHHHRRAAQLADDPRGVGARQPLAARDGADERHRQRARADLAGQPGRRHPAQPADRRVQPGGAAAPGLLRAQGAQGDRSRGRRRPARRRRRLRADHVPRARLAGRRGPVAARLPPGHHQRARAAVPVVRRRARR